MLNPYHEEILRAKKENRLHDILTDLESKRMNLDKEFSIMLEQPNVKKAMDKFQLEKEEWSVYKNKIKEYNVISEAIIIAKYHL